MRILIISDVHANIEALQALKEPYDYLLCLGDLVDYGPSPREALAFLQERASYGVRGNHDTAVGYHVDCQCVQPYRELSITTRDYMWQVLDEDHLSYLRRLPVNLTQVLGGARFYLCHAAPSNNLYRYLPYDSPDTVWQDEAARVQADFILIGHTHQQFVKQVGQKTFMNPGSLGQPKGVGPVACYAIWEDGQVELKRMPYPFRETMAKIDDTPLAPDIKEKLKMVLERGVLD
jgi:putative phosphoesterase